MKLAGAISDVPGRAYELAHNAARASIRGAQTIVEALYSAPRIALFSIRRPDETRDDLVTGESSQCNDRFWFATERAQPADPRSSTVDVNGTVERLRTNLEGAFVGVRIQDSGELTIYTDSWGLGWTCVRRMPDAMVFASDFAAVCRADGGAPALDPESLLLELSIGYSPDDRTIFADIDFAHPGSAMRIGANRIAQESSTHPRYGDAWFDATTEAKYEALDRHFERMAARAARLAGGNAPISLSAGYDSRYALAHLSRANAVGKLLTFGEPESDEVIQARAVAGRHREPPDWSLFSVPETSWEDWAEMIQSLGNAGVVQWCGWADQWLSFVRRQVGACVTGYLGDALSGKRLDALQRRDALANQLDPGLDLWTRRWIAFELDMGEWAQSALLRPHARRQLQRVAAQRFAAMSATPAYASDFQRAFHCNLVGRQRRWVGTQPAFMHGYVTPINFFVDLAYREFWMNVGLDDLLGQSLYLRYAQDRLPRFFPKPPGPARRFVARAKRRMQYPFAAALGRDTKRPPPIVRSRLLAPHLARIRETIENARPFLDDIVDVAGLRQAFDAFAGGSVDARLTTGMLFRCVNVTHLVALAAQAESRP